MQAQALLIRQSLLLTHLDEMVHLRRLYSCRYHLYLATANTLCSVLLLVERIVLFYSSLNVFKKIGAMPNAISIPAMLIIFCILSGVITELTRSVPPF